MSAVGIVDLIGLLATILACAILLRGWNQTFGRGSRLLIVSLLALALFHNSSNVLEWGGISNVLDPFEDYIQIMEPLFFGFFIYVYLISIEVDERTYELREAQEELVQSERLATLGQLGSGVAHELRNPLGVISNAAYLLKSSLIDADEITKEYLELISSEVGVSTQIIANLLNVSRKTDPIMGTVRLSELIANVLERQPPPTGVEVSTTVDDDLSVYADPSHLVQVLENIFSNAYQAMPEGGELTIETHTENKAALILVTDTGAGIPEDNLDKIFEPLFTTKARGIGLGLTLSKNLIEANGSSITVESIPGKGTTFTINLHSLS